MQRARKPHQFIGELIMENNRTLTLLNFSGDITLAWSKEQDDLMKSLIEEKLKEGYSFFSYQENSGFKKFFKKESEVKVQSFNDIQKREVILKNIDDEEIASFVQKNKIGIYKMTKNDFDTIKRLKDATEIVKNNTVAVRPIQGG